MNSLRLALTFQMKIFDKREKSNKSQEKNANKKKVRGQTAGGRDQQMAKLMLLMREREVMG